MFKRTWTPSRGHGRLIADGGKARHALGEQRLFRPKRGITSPRGRRCTSPTSASTTMRSPARAESATSSRPPIERDAERARDDRDVRGLRGLLDDESRDPVAPVIEELRRSHRARDDNGVLGKRIGIGAVAGAHEMPQQPARQIVEIVQAAAQIGIVGAIDAGARLVLHALDGGLGGQAGADRVGSGAAASPGRCANSR